MKLFFRLAENWSRDHLKGSFSTISPQGCIFTLRHTGWFGISVKKYVKTFHWISEILKYKDFWKFLGEWFSICAQNGGPVAAPTPPHRILFSRPANPTLQITHKISDREGVNALTINARFIHQTLAFQVVFKLRGFLLTGDTRRSSSCEPASASIKYNPT